MKVPVALSAIGLTLLTTTVLASGGQYISPCPPESDEARAARRALNQLGQQIRSLSPDEDASSAVKRLSELRDMRCFEGSSEATRPASGARSASLKQWWVDGGEAWLRSYLELAAGSRTIVIPPDMRTTLSAAPGTALATVVCPSGKRCPESNAWKQRTQSAMTAVWKADLRSAPRPKGVGFPERKDCVSGLADVPEEERYRALHDCWERSRAKSPVLPLGDVRIPKQGWLILRGRRGHYSFCDELRAYSLETGSAYIAQSCSALSLVTGGHVDARATDAGRRVEVTTGRVPVDALRDTTLLLLIGDSVDTAVQAQAERLELPAGLEAGWWRQDHGTGHVSGSTWVSTAQTSIAWAFHPPVASAAEGTFKWPHSSNPAKSLAAKWMGDLEERLEKGCPSERAPTEQLRAMSAPRVNARDAPDGVSAVHDALLSGLASAVPECAGSLGNDEGGLVPADPRRP
jgi:hypothetical protein